MRRSGLHLRVGHKAAARTRAATLRALLERANPLAACVPRATLSAASALAGRSWAAMAHDGRCIYRLANADAQRQGQEAREHASQQRREPEQRRACSTRLESGNTWLARRSGSGGGAPVMGRELVAFTICVLGWKRRSCPCISPFLSGVWAHFRGQRGGQQPPASGGEITTSELPLPEPFQNTLTSKVRRCFSCTFPHAMLRGCGACARAP